ncbi:MAG: DUF5050 domain-containing protein, partial [candidate division Zixibacteria bacterium]|nr:DUF5050 domain-containing protein [candidate division Zixibacteria bacterium]
VTENEDPGYQIGPPIISPTDDVLVYRVLIEEEGGSSYSNILKQKIGSSGKTLVTYGKWLDLFPSFTPNGKYLLFSSGRSQANPTLWRISVEGGAGITRITGTLAEDYSPCVSPNGEIISYASNLPRAEEPQIWTIGMNGTLPTQLREGETPQISPDGKKILFVRRDRLSKKRQIWMMNVDGTSETQLTQNNEYDAIDPRWSPDGNWIIYSSDEGYDSHKRRNFDIWLMTSDGSRKTQLTTNGSRDDSPCWDRTGKYVYLRSNRGGAWNIWRFEPILP